MGGPTPTERTACRKMIAHYKEKEASYFAKDWFGEHVHAMAMTEEASTATGAKLSPGLVYYPKLAVKKALQSHIAQKSADTQRENRHNTPIHPKKVRATRSDLATERLKGSDARHKINFDG